MSGPDDLGGSRPGWYDDPTGRCHQRYWDGTSWTQHVQTGGVPSVDPLDAAPTIIGEVPATSGVTSVPARSGTAGRWKTALAAVFVVLATYLLLMGLLAIMAPAGFTRFSPLNDKVSVMIFLRDDASGADVESLRQSLLAKSALVKSVSYTSKEQALERFKKDMADSPEVIQKLEGNPLPASLDVEARDPQSVMGIVDQVKQDPIFPNVADSPDNPEESLRYGQQVMDKLSAALAGLRVLGFLLLLPAAFLGVVAAILLATSASASRAMPVFWAVAVGLCGSALTAVALYKAIEGSVLPGVMP